MKSIAITVVLSLVLLSQTGCAFVGKGLTNKKKVRLESHPPGAEVLICGEHVGKTPLSTKLSPSTHEIQFSKAGYRTVVVKTEASSRTMGKVALGVDSAATLVAPFYGLPALGVDLATGSYKSHPGVIHVDLVPNSKKPCKNCGKVH